MGVNYDPVKAHEYYEQHKKLKGRKKSNRSIKGFSTTQKEQWSYAQHQLQEEHRDNGKRITENSKQERKKLSDACKNKIAQLRARVKAMPKEQREALRGQISVMVDNLRSQLKIDKTALTDSTKESRASEREAYEKRKDMAYQRIKSGGGK